jgi:hypothetical protein
MSIAILNKVFDEYPFSGSERTTLLLLANYADEHGCSVRPSVSTIAHRLRVTARSAQKSLRKLEAQGVISVVANQFGGKPGMVRHYKINTEMIANPLIDISATGVVLGTRRVSFRVQDGCRPRQAIEKKEIEIKEELPKHTDNLLALESISSDIELNEPKKTNQTSGERFPEFWVAYPQSDRKGAQNKCRQVWIEKNFDQSADLILAHLKSMNEKFTANNCEYCPKPINYLTGEGWDGFDPTPKYDPRRPDTWGPNEWA